VLELFVAAGGKMHVEAFSRVVWRMDPALFPLFELPPVRYHTNAGARLTSDPDQWASFHEYNVRAERPPSLLYSDERVANRDVRDFGWEIAHGAVARRPPISFCTIVARTGSYAYDVGVWDLSIVQGPFSFAPCQTLTLRFATFASLCAVWKVDTRVRCYKIGLGCSVGGRDA
jgi:hypothetical protein